MKALVNDAAFHRPAVKMKVQGRVHDQGQDQMQDQEVVLHQEVLDLGQGQDHGLVVMRGPDQGHVQGQRVAVDQVPDHDLARDRRVVRGPGPVADLGQDLCQGHHHDLGQALGQVQHHQQVQGQGAVLMVEVTLVARGQGQDLQPGHQPREGQEQKVTDNKTYITLVLLELYIQQTRNVHPMLGYCWTSVEDGDPMFTQHWVNVSCLLEGLYSVQPEGSICLLVK